MATDRVLIEILTTADMAGVGAADAGFLGLGISAGVATAGIGALLLAGKSMIEISTEHATVESTLAAAIDARNKASLGGGTIDPKAVVQQAKDEASAQKAVEAATDANTSAKRRLLEMEVTYNAQAKHSADAYMLIQDQQARVSDTSQALQTAEARLTAAQKETTVSQKAEAVSASAINAEIQKFLDKNRDYISNQNDVVAGYSALIREGVPFADLTKDMNIALEIQAQDGGTLADAVMKLQGAEAGRNVGLKTAVGLTLEAIPANATLAEKEAIVRYNLDQVSAAYGNQLPKLTSLQIAQDHLSTTWEKMAEKDGPGLISAMADIVNAIDTGFLPAFQRAIDQNNAFAESIEKMVSHPSWEQLYNVLFGQGTGFHVIKGGLIDRFINAQQAPNPTDLGAASGGVSNQASNSANLAQQLRITGAFQP
jgi:hypothetical protein